MKVGARPYQAGARYRQESGSGNSRPEAGARNGIEKSSQSQTGVRHRQGGNQMKVGARPYQVGARYRQESCSRPEAGAITGIQKSSQSLTGVRHKQGANKKEAVRRRGQAQTAARPCKAKRNQERG